eukprot:COSAG02_NODE_412_length_22836_cov_41.209966_2_plen_117_part_00
MQIACSFSLVKRWSYRIDLKRRYLRVSSTKRGQARARGRPSPSRYTAGEGGHSKASEPRVRGIYRKLRFVTTSNLRSCHKAAAICDEYTVEFTHSYTITVEMTNMQYDRGETLNAF